MFEYNGKILKIYNDNNWYFIELKNQKFKCPIINGTVDIVIMNYEKNEVGIKYLEIGDLIKIFSFEKSSKKYIIPIKIFINTKYVFNNDSSESEDLTTE